MEEKKITLKDISEFMLNFLMDRDVNTGILDFWKNFETDEQFMYVATGKWASDDFDLNQGRDTLLERSEVAPLMFNYLTETLGLSSDDFHSRCWNTMGVVEEIGWLYKEQENANQPKSNQPNLNKNNQVETNTNPSIKSSYNQNSNTNPSPNPNDNPNPKLTLKDYLLPRYEVMFNYPLGLFSKGDILVPLKSDNQLYKNNNFRLKTGFVEVEEQPEIHYRTILNHPYIFRKVEWWEHRLREELPDKVQDIINPHIKDISELDINQISELLKSSYFLPVV